MHSPQETVYFFHGFNAISYQHKQLAGLFQLGLIGTSLEELNDLLKGSRFKIWRVRAIYEKTS